MTPRAQHVAIIMDGNGRWANQRKMPRYQGHANGAHAVRRAINAAINNEIKYLTLFAFSSENINRSPKEINFLKNIFYKYITEKLDELHENNIKVIFIGDLQYFSDKLNDCMRNAVELTKNNTGLVLTVALNYGGRWDIVQACNRILEEKLAKISDSQNLSLNGLLVTEDIFNSYLSTSGLPDPDLLIRTSGEQRISNFLIWQFAYTELFFTNVYWPDFTEDDFEKALNFYYNCNRRFGLAEDLIR